MTPNRRPQRWIAFGLAMILFAFMAQVSSADETREGIEAANRAFEAAVARGDGDGLSELYTSDAQLLPTGSQFVTGTEAIAAFWQAVFDSGVKAASLETLEVEAHGDTANEVGSYVLRGAEGQTLDRGKYIVVWKRQGDAWKLHRDIWNTSIVAK